MRSLVSVSKSKERREPKIWSALLTLMLEMIVLAGETARGFSKCDVEAHGSSVGLGDEGAQEFGLLHFPGEVST